MVEGLTEKLKKGQRLRDLKTGLSVTKKRYTHEETLNKFNLGYWE